MIRFNLVNRLKSLREELKKEVFERNHLLSPKVELLSADLFSIKELYSKYDMERILDLNKEGLKLIHSDVENVLSPICKRWYNFAPKTVKLLSQLCEQTLYF